VVGALRAEGVYSGDRPARQRRPQRFGL